MSASQEMFEEFFEKRMEKICKIGGVLTHDFGLKRHNSLILMDKRSKNINQSSTKIQLR